LRELRAAVDEARTLAAIGAAATSQAS
jgi:hypothetical protein